MNRISRQLLQAASLTSTVSLLGLPLEALAQAALGSVVVIGTTQKPRHLNAAVQSGMDAQWKPQPYLTESFELSPDNPSVRLVLRQGAVFHDGRPMTGEDIKLSIETIRDHHHFPPCTGR